MKFSLSRETRLRRPSQYQAVRQARKVAHGRLFSLALSEQPSSITQCGFIVSRRVGGAVTRNRVKRRLRHLYRHERSTLTPGLWLVLGTKPAAAHASLVDLRAEWLRLGKRLTIFA